MAYSSGFNPHPRISYAGAAPTGSASEAEYLEIALAEIVDPASVHEALAEALPDGLDVLQVVQSPGGALADLLTASHWRIELDLSSEVVAAAVEQFLAADDVTVERMTKKGLRQFDCRAAVVSMVCESVEHGATVEQGAALELVLRVTTPAVRPDDVLTGLRSLTGLTPVGAPKFTRLVQGPLTDEGTVGDPLA